MVLAGVILYQVLLLLSLYLYRLVTSLTDFSSTLSDIKKLIAYLSLN